jgi:hypothetical protein
MKRIGKFAVQTPKGDKSRGLCVCQDGSSDHARVGALATLDSSATQLWRWSAGCVTSMSMGPTLTQSPATLSRSSSSR